MLPHDQQRQHLSSSAPTVVIFEKTINWVCLVNHFEFKQNKTEWSETAGVLRMGFVCLLPAVESEGKGGCLNLCSPGGAYTFTKQNEKPLLAANKRGGEMQSMELK